MPLSALDDVIDNLLKNCPQVTKPKSEKEEECSPGDNDSDLRSLVDEALRYKLLSDLFSEWLKQQIEQFEIKIDLNSSDLVSTAQSQTPIAAPL